MTPYAFDYAQAGSVQDALSLMDRHGDGAKLLAGGHSLLPAMKLRLSAPAVLIDVNGIDELRQISADGGHLHLGALVTHRMVEYSDVVRAKCPVLAEAVSLIGDPQVRNRGTIGGSLAHADPAADYPALVLALGATIEVAGASGRRTIAARDYFVGMFTTALQPKEMITKVSIPVLEAGSGAAYAKFANPASRYAVVGVAALVQVDGQGRCTAARVGVTGAAPSAFRAEKVEQALVGQALDAQAVGQAVAGMVDPADLMSDLSGSADYRAHLCAVMAKRAILDAAARAR
jgi:carbon-monoxide dehydrogenase medium subunit